MNILEEDISLVSNETGEVVGVAKKGERVIIRSPAQAENDKYWSPPVKINGRFVKFMIENEDELYELLKGFPMVQVAFMRVIKYTKANENILIKDGRKFKTIDLAGELGVSRQSASFYIRKMKECNLIAELDKGRAGKFLVVNPRYFLNGETLPKATLKLFERERR